MFVSEAVSGVVTVDRVVAVSGIVTVVTTSGIVTVVTTSGIVTLVTIGVGLEYLPQFVRHRPRDLDHRTDTFL